jgi:hypothetical protein
MSRTDGIVHRVYRWWPEIVVPPIFFLLGMWVGLGPLVGFVAWVVAAVVVAIFKPRPSGRWTE